MPPRTKFPDWAAEKFHEIGPLLIEADDHLSPDEVIELLVEETEENQLSAEDVYQEWHDHGRVWEHPDGTVRVTKPEQLNIE